MPTYHYHCPSCQKDLQIFHKISEGPITLCPECKKEGLQKQITAAGFQLKGSGWYNTDFRDKKSGDKNGDKASGEKSSDKTSGES